MTASAVWFTGPRAAVIREEVVPEVGAGEIRVRAIASGISQGTEMLVYRGEVPPDLPLDLPTLRGSFAFPIKYGYASVGQVVEIGPQVDGLSAGSRVFVHHPHQSEYVVAAALATPLPADLPADAGTFLANVETAVNVLLDTAPRLGERIVVFGQGVVGLLVTQLAKRAGAGVVLAVDALPDRRAAAVTLGADAAFSPDDDLPTAVRAHTDGIGADIAIEVSGNPRALQASIDSVAFGGTVVVCSWYGTKAVPLELGGAFHRRRLRLVSSQVSTIEPALQARWTHGRRLALARDLLSQLRLQELVRPRMRFDQAADAYRLVDERPNETLQVVLTYGDDV